MPRQLAFVNRIILPEFLFHCWRRFCRCDSFLLVIRGCFAWQPLKLTTVHSNAARMHFGLTTSVRLFKNSSDGRVVASDVQMRGLSIWCYPLPLSGKLQAKLFEVEPLETDVDYWKKKRYSSLLAFFLILRSLLSSLLCKIARYWNPSLIEGTYRWITFHLFAYS
jgi:hypothetical protein